MMNTPPPIGAGRTPRSDRPLTAGLGLLSPHVQQVLAERPAVAWWEVHSENYFGGGAPILALETLRADTPISLHGVGLGLGNVAPPDHQHLEQLRLLCQRIAPALISEHLAWNHSGHQWFNDLLPVPRVDGALRQLVQNIDQVQTKLQRKILLENISAYVRFPGEILSEAELLSELVARTGCGILLDLNNLYVNQLNLGINAREQLMRLPLTHVGEIHIAGYEVFDGQAIDTHGAEVSDAVWQLLAETLALTGPLPVLLERDTHLPPLEQLLGEYQQLEQRLALAGDPR